MKPRDFVLLYVNGVRHEVKLPEASLMLSDYLRKSLLLTGTKIVCAEGDCGACSVLRATGLTPNSKQPIRFEALNSCITQVAQMDGAILVTVDALSKEGELSLVQKAMLTSDASQCGFCTPGFVIALTGLCEKRAGQNRNLETQESKNALTGNLCRCTGYEPILEAARRVSLKEYEPLKKRFFSLKVQKDVQKTLKRPYAMKNDTHEYLAPATLKEAARALSKDKTSKIFSGGTDLGVLINKGKIRPLKKLSLHLIPELFKVSVSKNKIRVGARVTLSELRRATEKSIPEFSRFLDLFASPQIKNVATLVGNLANASPIGDTLPFLLVSNTKVNVFSMRGKRTIPIEKLFLGYRKLSLKPGEFIESVEFEAPKKTETLRLYKTSQRKDLDISAVSLAIVMERAPKKDEITGFKIALGGVAATPVRLPKLEKKIKGMKLHELDLDLVIAHLQEEIAPLGDLRGSAAFRRVIAGRTLKSYFSEARA